MGLAVTKLWHRFTRQKLRMLIMGLDAAGKTTMAYMLQPEQPLPPRFGFHVESFDYENLSFTVWDPATNDRLVAFRRQHYKGVQGIVFVADSCDRERLGEASEELQELFDMRSYMTFRFWSLPTSKT